MKCICILLLLCSSVFADLDVNIYRPSTTAPTQTSSGCIYVGFSMITAGIKIGGATFSNFTGELPIQSTFRKGPGQHLNAVPYQFVNGTVIITEVR